MADGVSMTVRNKDRLLAKLRRLAPAAQDALEEANRKTAEEMATTARSLVPVHTGALRDSIAVTPPGHVPPAYAQGAGGVVPAGAYAVTAGNRAVRYAHFAEYGTAAHVNAGLFAGTQNPGSRRQSFFWPAYRLIRRKMRSRATRAIRAAAKLVAAGR